MKLPDLEFDGEPIPDGFTPLEGIVILTGLNSDGRELVVRRATAGLATYSAIGLLTVTSDVLRHELLEED